MLHFASIVTFCGVTGLFPKGSVHSFGQQMGFFPPFYFWQKGKKKVFSDILERKNACLHYKNKKLKNKKIGLFSKGLVHGFGQKKGFFPPFYFWQNRQEKSLWPYSRKRKRL